ncbi:hypothetical protein PG994_004749 [Apiospora phragmitis]|uniref:DUF1690 domain-containing protein n=1 Tax=Apiospora phragmitis TaxID=2905665 RepID=A0ABR1VUI2_9PEZI
MGASSSKAADGQSSAYVWKASGPVGVSQDVVERLQGNSESDVSRAQSLELAVQARVAEELKKLEKSESAALKAAYEKATTAADDGDGQQQDGGKNRHTVSKEVEALRARLDKRKQLRVLPDSVERARTGVLECLRDNDRRPLNCWQEVENFREQVRQLEKEWVDRVVR